MNTDQTDEMLDALRRELAARRTRTGMWRGELSSSAVSTAVALFALQMADREGHAPLIERGMGWLRSTMRPDGSWGDTPESPSNLTATLLAWASMHAAGVDAAETRDYIAARFGGTDDRRITQGVLAYYGRDLTFSVPILVMCALAGIISDWRGIPQLPFEVSTLPQGLFRFFRLPVVSYAIPALIAVGILRFKKGRGNVFSPVRRAFVKPSLETLTKLQPSDGGFLEAAPLTAFVAMCMCGAGYGDHPVTVGAVEFLVAGVRPDGSWPIDTDLACWVTSLAARALGDELDDRAALADLIRSNAFKHRHPFTGARGGGWGWSDLPGAVPDADDTAGALVALHALRGGEYCAEVGKGVEWLLALQNADGGMPTFCRGWGRLPFDRGTPDISAHSILAFTLWADSLPRELRTRCLKSTRKMLRWMERRQAADGSWTPLWFGDQDAADERSPVYGTATACEYLSVSREASARDMAARGAAYLSGAQNADGGWGGAPGAPSKTTLTARALGALASCRGADVREALERGADFLYARHREGRLLAAEPIGLYFSRLWYSEELYNITFTMMALKKLKIWNG